MSDQPQSGLVNSTLDGIIRFGKEFGAIALILGFYMGQDAGLIGNPVADKLEKLQKEVQEIKGLGIQHDSSMRELTRNVEEQGRQLEDEAKGRQLRCVMRAQSDAEKKACFPHGKE